MSSKSSSATSPSIMVTNVSDSTASRAKYSSIPETSAMHTSMMVADMEYSMNLSGLTPLCVMSLA